ncbi:hypothetical protein ACVU7I_05385 [Patulibacter sp. S7RM1-6]
MSGRLGAAAGVVVLVGLLAVPHVAGARPWTAEYDWQASSRTGYENWVAEESVPGSGQPLPFYRSYLGGAPAQIGRGLAIAPLGGRVYDNGNPAGQTGGPGLIKPRGGIDRKREVVLVQLDRARGNLRDPDKTGGRYGNFSETELRPVIFGGKGITADEVYDDLELERLRNALEQNNQMLGLGKKPAAVEKLARLAARAARFVDRANFVASVLDPLINPDVVACANTHQKNLITSARRTWDHVNVASFCTGLVLEPEWGDPNEDVAKTQKALANARLALRQLGTYAEQYKKATDGGKYCGIYATAVLAAVSPAMDAVIHMFIAHNAAVRPKRDPKDRLYGCDSADATQMKSLPRSLNRRWNLCWWTKLKPGNGGIPEKAQAHHLFPQEFREGFRTAGIAVDEPWYMCWFGAGHQGMSKAYNREWQVWLRRRGRLNPSDRLAAISYMYKLQIRPNFACDVKLNEKHSASLGDRSQRVEPSPGI